MDRNLDLPVGNGPLTKTGIVTTATGWLTTLAALITTLSNNLPEGVDPKNGLYLTAALGLVSTLSELVTVWGRVSFAKAKAAVLAGESAVPVFLESFEDDGLEDEPTDTQVPPPVEPV